MTILKIEMYTGKMSQKAVYISGAVYWVAALLNILFDALPI